MSAAWAPVLARFKAGALSAQVAMAQLLLSGDPPDAARLERLANDDAALRPLAELAVAHGPALAQLGTLAGNGIDPEGEDMVAATAALFDRMAATSPAAAVAFYSLGDDRLLARATDELAEVIAAWVPLAGRDLCDLGCGIARLAIALAPGMRSVVGIDVSPAMVAEAQTRTAGLANVRIEQGSGRDLALLPDESVDILIAADSFPYLVRAGVVDRHLAEIARVLRPGGDLLVFNWSYRGDVSLDVAEARALAEAHGLTIRRAEETPFSIWDGTGFHLVRPA